MRGNLALLFVCTGLLIADPIQRFIISPWVKIRASARVDVLTWWLRKLAWFIIRSFRLLGGANIPDPPEIPGGDGVLILMNHQSVMDIPLVVASVTGTSPRIVTRQRYARWWVPLISHLIKLYQYPVVNPGATREDMQDSLDFMAKVASDEGWPLAIFPEGTRTKDGEIARFKTTGLKVILKQRRWTVYSMVVDGFWERAKLKDFLRGISTMQGKMELVRTYEWDDPEAAPGPFLRLIRNDMVERLAQIREGATA